MRRAVRRRVTLVLVLALAVGAVLTAPSVYTLATNTHLDILTKMSPREAERYLDKHPHVEFELLDSAPEEVADWWDTLSRKDRKSLIRAAPDLIGNLGGIDYTSRDVANRRHLKQALAKAKKAAAASPGDETEKLVLQSLTAIKATIDKSGTPKRHLVLLLPDRPPLAAVAIGDLDTAKQVTFDIPGMGTYSNDMQLWSQSAQNVYEMQGKVGAPDDRAVVAWIGYVTPPPGIDAALGDYAARGAPKVASAIDSFRAARTDRPARTVNIIAHSYGTTTSANALFDNDLDLYSYVMFGSAGVENRIGNAEDLSARHVYAGEATRDERARWGRVTRRDPLSPAFGATHLGVDGDAALGLSAVTGHEPVLHSKWNDNPKSSAWSGIKNFGQRMAEYLAHKRSHGYLDPGTESLRNGAIATTRNPTATITH